MIERLLMGLPLQTSSGLEIYPYRLKEIMEIGIGMYNFNISLFTLNEKIIENILNIEENILEELLKNKYILLMELMKNDDKIKENILDFLKHITKKHCKFVNETNLLSNGIVLDRKEYIDILKMIGIEENMFFNILRDKDTRKDVLDVMEKLLNKELSVLQEGIYIENTLLDSNTYDEIIKIIKLQNSSEKEEEDDEDECHSDNPAIRAMFEKRKKIRAKLKKAKSKESSEEEVDLTDLISSACFMGANLNLLNIGELTIYQLYDTIKRYNIKNKFDIGLKSIMAGANSKDIDLKDWTGKIKIEND